MTRRAAVLILLFADRKGDLKVVLTIRSAKLKNCEQTITTPTHHTKTTTTVYANAPGDKDAGQAALPGGKADALSESPWETTRREAYEEIGLPTTDDNLPPGYSVEHLTELPANLAMTELGVRPCVAWLKHVRQENENPGSDRAWRSGDPDPSRDILPRIDAKEVAAMFTAPFENFLLAHDAEERDRAVEGNWYKGSWHSWHEEAWRMHQFFVPTVGRGSVFRSAHPANTGLDAETAACSPVAPTPVLLADLRASEEKASATGGESMATEKSHSTLTPPLPRRPHTPSPSPSDALAQPRYRVFGMTARILVDAARVAYAREPEFEHNSHFGDEDMIARLMRIGRLKAEKSTGEVLTRDVMVRAKKEGGGKL